MIGLCSWWDKEVCVKLNAPKLNLVWSSSTMLKFILNPTGSVSLHWHLFILL